MAFALRAHSAYIAPMPKGPQGQKRPADVIGAAIRVARIATGEEVDCVPEGPEGENTQAASAGGKARARKLTPHERSKIAKKAASHRWGQKADPEQENAE